MLQQQPYLPPPPCSPANPQYHKRRHRRLRGCGSRQACSCPPAETALRRRTNAKHYDHQAFFLNTKPFFLLPFAPPRRRPHFPIAGTGLAREMADVCCRPGRCFRECRRMVVAVVFAIVFADSGSAFHAPTSSRILSISAVSPTRCETKDDGLASKELQFCSSSHCLREFVSSIPIHCQMMIV